jgi:hypothetical protein
MFSSVSIAIHQHVHWVMLNHSGHAVYRVLNVFIPNATVVRENAGSKRDVSVHPTNDHILVATGENMIEPPFVPLCRGNVWMLITTHNDLLMSKTRWSRTYEQFSFKGARNDTVWGRHMPPVNGKLQRAPLAFLIHGGPQNSWYDSWGRGWRFQTYASQGYAVIAINFHGSDSYGENLLIVSLVNTVHYPMKIFNWDLRMFYKYLGISMELEQ